MPVVSLKEIVDRAFTERYGVPAINIVNDLTLEAVLAGAVEARSPLIVQTSVKTVKSIGLNVLWSMWESMTAGIALSRWFGNEARRLYAELDETGADREQRELVELIRLRGGAITSRDLARSSRRYRAPGAADEALEALKKAGLGAWEEQTPSPAGGRPTWTFRLTH